MKFFRIHTDDIAFVTGQPRGLFVAVWKFVDSKLVTPDEEAEYWRNRKRFEEALPVPPYYAEGNPQKAITFFRDNEFGNRVFGQMTFYRAMARKYGLRLYRSEVPVCPGELVYEDDFQIGVVLDPRFHHLTRTQALES